MGNRIKKNRIWELDALRGIAILGVLCVHVLFDLRYLFGVRIDVPVWFDFVQKYGGILFVLISGVCVTLGSHPIKRGAVVFGAGMAVTLVTFTMEKIDPVSFSGLLITFGVLHLLGVAMMTYPLYKKLPFWTVALIGAVIVVLGYIINTKRASFPLCEAVGIPYAGYTAGDWFPLCPYLGWFMVGTALGKTLYKNKRSLLPFVPENFFVIRFLRFCGRQSLWIYLVHQPLVYGILYLLFMIIK